VLGRASHVGSGVALVATFALILVACGGGESDGATSTSRALDTGQSTSTSQGTATTQADAPVPALGATSWTVADYGLPTVGTMNVWPDTEVTLSFGADGSVSGSTGCNQYSGNFEVEGPYDEFEDGVRDEEDGQTIQIVVLSVTERGCSPDHVMEQETEILSLLEGVDRWFMARGELILRSSDGFFLQADPTG